MHVSAPMARPTVNALVTLKLHYHRAGEVAMHWDGLPLKVLRANAHQPANQFSDQVLHSNHFRIESIGIWKSVPLPEVMN